MYDRILLSAFFLCLVVCAGMVLIAIWAGEGAMPQQYFQAAASLFVIGLASFLTWFVLTLRRIAAKVRTS